MVYIGRFHLFSSTSYLPAAKAVLGRSMAQPYVQTFAFPNGRSRKGRPVLQGRSISGHTRPQIRFPQHTPQPFFLDIFRTMLEGCLLRLDCTMLRLVLFSIHLPYPNRGSDSVPARKRYPALAWLDDFWLTNEKATHHGSSEDQARATHSATCLALTMFYKCGYFMTFSKCSLASSTRRVFLGVICDSKTRHFEVPADTLDKLEALLRQAIHNAWISFVNLEKLAGECTSMSVAVPPASLYTYHMYHQIARFRRTGGSSILARVNVPPNGGLRYEMEQWLAVWKRMNGSSWYDPAHHSIAITSATDASSQGWGRVVRNPHASAKEFRAAADFPPDFAQAHINIEETFALR